MPVEAFDYELFAKGFSKRFGNESIIDLKKQPRKGEPGTYVQTGSYALDYILGIGGFPLGRIVEIFGPESSGKSTLALHALKELQTLFPKKPVGYLDVEHAVNREYAEMIGIDLSPKRFVFVQESGTEKVLDMMNEMAKAGFSGVVVDSVAGMITEDEIKEQDTTHGKFGGNSKLMSSHMRHIKDSASASGTLAIYLNQIREKFVMFGNPETTSGGRALAFYSSVRLRTQIAEQIKPKDGGPPIGARIKAKTVKNKVAPPYRECEYDLIYGKGIDRTRDLIDTCEKLGILTKKGAWYNFGDKQLVNGKDAMVTLLGEDAKLVKLLSDTLAGSY